MTTAVIVASPALITSVPPDDEAHARSEIVCGVAASSWKSHVVVPD